MSKTSTIDQVTDIANKLISWDVSKYNPSHDETAEITAQIYKLTTEEKREVKNRIGPDCLHPFNLCYDARTKEYI